MGGGVMGRFRTGAACAALLLPLAACGGGGGSATPPITLNGVSYDRPANGDSALNLTEGGDGPSVIYVDEGTMEFLGRQLAGSTTFRADDGSVAFVTAPQGYESTRFIRIQYAENGAFVRTTEGVIGRFTSEALMATARGSATYRGVGTADVRVEGAGGFDLTGGNTTVNVNFGTRTVDATLDFVGTPSDGNAIDQVLISGMRISGNRFSGGSLESRNDGARVGAFSVASSALQSSGVFAGWNDTTGAVAGGNRPAEVGGAFVADAGVNVLTGRYLAD